MRNASAARTSAVLRTRIALITLQPVRRATSRQNAGALAAVELDHVSDSFSAAAATLVERRVHEHADDLQLRLSAAAISTAASGSQ